MSAASIVTLKFTPGRSRYMVETIEPVESEMSDIEAPLPATYEITTYPADFTLEILVDKFKKKEIHITPIERRFVWSQTQSSKLIESFLLGLPVPPIYFYQDRKDNSLVVIDGQQRLKSIVYYFTGRFEGAKPVPFELIGLHEKSPYLGKTYDALKEENQKAFNKLQNSVLRAVVMKQIDPDDDTSIFQVFERLNTGGVTLQGQEIRNCIYEGAFNDLLGGLNKNLNWRKIFGTKHVDKRMRDIELILRFFALFYNRKHYQKPMKQFLNDFMRVNRRPTAERLQQFRELFTNTAKVAVQVLGERPFHIQRGLNAAVFDSSFTAFADESMTDVTSTTKDRISTRFRKLKKDTRYLKWVESATTDVDVVSKRLNRARTILFL